MITAKVGMSLAYTHTYMHTYIHIYVVYKYIQVVLISASIFYPLGISPFR